MNWSKHIFFASATAVGGFVSASILNSVVATHFIMPTTMVKGPVNNRVIKQYDQGATVRRFAESILMRNIFDSENKQLNDPEAEVKVEPEEEKPAESGPCRKSKVPIKLIGTLVFPGSDASIASIVEKGFKDPDNYQVGEYLFDEGEILIVEIKRNVIVLDNNGKKECVYSDEKGKEFAEKRIIRNTAAEESSEEFGDLVIMEPNYIDQELGPGFANILNKQRLVPNIDKTGKSNGFKIFSIQAGSLFARAGFKDGDIITGINQHDLQDPAQGFKLFETIKDEKEITINFIRNGNKNQRYIKIK